MKKKMKKNICVWIGITLVSLAIHSLPVEALSVSFDQQEIFYKNKTFTNVTKHKDSYVAGTKGKIKFKTYPLDIGFAFATNRSTSGTEIKDKFYLKISDHSLKPISVYLGGQVMKIKKNSSNQDYHAFLGAYYTYKEHKKNLFQAGATLSVTQFDKLGTQKFENNMMGFEPFITFYIRPAILKGSLKFKTALSFQWLEKSFFKTFKSSQVSIEQQFSYQEGPWESGISFWSALNEHVSFPIFDQGYDVDHYGDGYTGVLSAFVHYNLDKNASLSLSYSLSEFYELSAKSQAKGHFSDSTSSLNTAKIGYSFYF